ncbi:MAG TPA: adenylate kinase [Herpetosiphonaceae bacterium]
MTTEQPLHIILMGAPGAGKSTQSRMLRSRYPVYVLATGQMLRDEVARRTALGLLADSYFQRGTLLPDDVMIALITERLLQLRPDQGFLLDGFPRTVPQAEALDSLMQRLDRSLSAVISLSLSDDEAIRRLGGRRMCEGLGEPFPLHVDDTASVDACLRLGGRLVTRPDDEPEVIVERLRVYEEETEPLIDYYRRQGLLHTISAEGDPETVQAQIVQTLDATGRGREQASG